MCEFVLCLSLLLLFLNLVFVLPRRFEILWQKFLVVQFQLVMVDL